MIVKLLNYHRVGFLRIDQVPDFSILDEPGKWDYIKGTPYVYGVNLDGIPYFDNWLRGKEARELFNILKGWAGEKRQLNVTFDGCGKAVFETVDYPADGEFH
jgi:hypothetical protein